MAAIVPKPLRCIKAGAGQGPEFDLLTVNATCPVGDLLLKTDGTANTCGADPTVITYLCTATGGAPVPGNTTGTVQRIRGSDFYRINAYSATPASAVLADTTLDGQANYGVVWATISGQAAWFLDVDDQVNVRVRLVGRTDGATDTYPEAIIQFLPSVLTYS